MIPTLIKLAGQIIVEIQFVGALDGEVYFLFVNELMTGVIQLCKVITVQS